MSTVLQEHVDLMVDPDDVTPECCQNLMCFMPTVTSLSILNGLLFTTKILSL